MKKKPGKRNIKVCLTVMLIAAMVFAAGVAAAFFSQNTSQGSLAAKLSGTENIEKSEKDVHTEDNTDTEEGGSETQNGINNITSDNEIASKQNSENTSEQASENISEQSSDQNGITDPDSGAEAPVSTIEAQARELLSSMTLTEQIYQMFIVKPEQLTGVSVQTQAGSTTEKALQQYPVGGIVYFAANIQTRDQVKNMISNTQSYSCIGLFIAVDEEGGTVARIGRNANMGTTSFPNMKEIGDTGDTDNAYNVGYTIGTEIAELGFNLDFAPVADVDSNPDNPVIGDRAFSSDAAVASDMVAAAVRGFGDSGMLCTLKHFPGHGDTSTDSHAGYTELDKTLEELQQVEFVPFQGGIRAGADFVMVGHISVPEVTGDDVPASLSPRMIRILREDLEFDGLIITDSMQMEAITDRYSSAEAAVLAIQAGVDIILMPEDLQAAAAGVQSAVEDGTISQERIEESVLRILEMKLRAGIES